MGQFATSYIEYSACKATKRLAMGPSLPSAKSLSWGPRRRRCRSYAFSKIGVIESVLPLASTRGVANASAQISLPLVALRMK